jgi:hypothetical protein
VLGTAPGDLIGTVSGMSYSRDLTDEQWAVLDPACNAPNTRGRSDTPTATAWTELLWL